MIKDTFTFIRFARGRAVGESSKNFIQCFRTQPRVNNLECADNILIVS